MSFIVRSIRRTCSFCPSQWEGETDDGRPVYIRYRHGWLMAHVGPAGGDIDDAVDARPFFDALVGDPHDGTMSLDQAARLTGIQLP